MRSLRFVSLATLAAALPLATATAQATAQATLPEDRASGAATVDEQQVKDWIYQLAGEEFAGRGTGQPGYGKAADYIAEHFRSLGLEARGKDGSYFQQLPWNNVTVNKATLQFTLPDGTTIDVGKDEMMGSISTGAQAEGEAVVLNLPVKGRGMNVELPDLDGVDVKGKVVVAIVHASGRQSAYARLALMQKMSGRGQQALVFASKEAIRRGLRGRSGMSRSGGNPAAAAAQRRPLDLTIGRKTVDKLLAACGLTFSELEDAPVTLPLTATATLDIAIDTKAVPAMNVWAVLPGSDPQLKNEYVVIGSHLDHLGERNGTIYPGADDDGSGTTGVLAASQMFAKNANRPKRSILFVCFSGEERGLIGSRYFADNCPIPLSSIVAELQMDMIGRSEEEARDGGRKVNKGETAEENANVLHLVGTEKFSPSLHALCMQRNETAGFEIEFDQESLFGRSDHYNFAKYGVPIAFFFTGLHRDYHQPTDTPDKIEYGKLLRVARYVYDIGYQLADQQSRPGVDPDLWQTFRQKNSRSRRGSSIPKQPAAPLLPK